MIIVDSSVWIDFFNGASTKESNYLDAVLGNEMVGMGDLILVEILQGFRQDIEYEKAKKRLQVLPIHTLLEPKRAIICAQNYRKLRKKGITIRKTADVIVASFCISEGHKLLFSDRDYQPFVEHLGLQSAV